MGDEAPLADGVVLKMGMCTCRDLFADDAGLISEGLIVSATLGAGRLHSHRLLDRAQPMPMLGATHSG